MDTRERLMEMAWHASLKCQPPKDWIAVDDALAIFAEERASLEAEAARERGLTDGAYNAMVETAEGLVEWKARAEKAEAREAKLVKVVEEMAGMDCARYDKFWDGNPCGVCLSCKARAVLRERKETK